ncbi:MAG: ATP-binding protein, partial [Defluviitaleaceae bacterium]|nr:ATP-binding protein [Defluviitaleaceae bacterium]
TELFGIPFVPVIFEELTDLMAGLENGTVHFTGQLPRMPFLKEIFAMTYPISKRSTAYVRIPNSRPLSEIAQERPLRFVFQGGSALPNVLRNAGIFDEFETIRVEAPRDATLMLKNGEADAYIGDGVLTLSIEFPGFRVEPIYPFLFSYNAFSARNPEFIPIIETVQKALENGAMSILAGFYAMGKEDIARHRMSLLLTDEEREFIINNPIIPIAAHGFSYPISFFDARAREQGLQGIAHDILRQVELITGLEFEILRPDRFSFNDTLQLLNDGEVYLVAGSFHTEGEYPFLLSSGFFSDNYTLLSRIDTPLIGANEVLYMRVGLIGSSYNDIVFHTMFPNHLQISRFSTQDEILDALEAGDVDLAFTSLRGLMRVTHLLERTGFRANIIFDKSYYISFAISENMPLLAPIIDKALMIVDTQSISDEWMGRTFDFNAVALRAQRPWLIGTIVSLAFVLVLSFILFRIQRRKVAMEHAEESNRAKTRFLARMSHEIRTPITAVLGISEVQLRNPDMPPYMEESLVKIHDSANTLLSIVNDILDFSRIESGKMTITTEEYEVASLVSDAAHLHMMYLEHKSTAFQMNVDENLPAVLVGDALRIRQIMNNLLSNAFKYTEAGVVTLSLGFENKREDDVTLVISVRDTGFGMTAKQLEAIKTSEYTRFHERDVSGTGLGIPIVYSLVKMMKARIDFESEVGHGTNVIVRIPQRIAGPELLGKEAAESLQNSEFGAWSATFKFEPEPMPYGKVLVVDDVDANLFVAKGLLAFYGLDIDTCTSGHDAAAKIKQGNVYDIVFMDEMMPGINGTETMLLLRGIGYTQPIVALTANALIGQAEEYIRKGFDGFISKPILPHHLDAVLNKFVRDKQPPEVIEAAKDSGVAAKGDINSYQNSDELVDKLKMIFTRSHRNTFFEISQALDTGDNDTAHRLAHTLKSAARQINELSLSQAAGHAEAVMRNGQTPTGNQLSVLNNELKRVLDSIGNPVAPGLPDKKDLDADKAVALLDELYPLLKSQNVKFLNYVEKLRAIPETAVLVRQIEDFDVKAAIKTMDVLRAILEEMR